MSFDPNFLDRLRDQVSIAEVVGRRVRLTRKGREHSGLCPFHNEKTPSFTVSEDKGFYHCLAGETGVILRGGVQPIAELAGRAVEVLTRGGIWVPAAFRAYGRQRLLRIELTRNGQSKTLYATSGHRWFVRGVRGARVTTDLRPGHRLESVLPRPRSDWTLDPEGVRHGVVFGDGSVLKGIYGHVHLHGAKDEALAGWFPEQAPVERRTERGQPYLRIYGGRAFQGVKALPSLDEPASYLLGFIAGYLAADGHVAKDGTVILNSAERTHLEWVRSAATRLGLATYGVSTARRSGFGRPPSDLHRIHFVPASLRPELFLLPQARARFEATAKRFARLRWVVKEVAETDREEVVYCAEVPGEHAFAIEDNILTGNCFGCGAHGDVIGFVMKTEGLSFPEAVEKLAGEANLPLPRRDPREAETRRQRAGLHEALEEACRWFQEQLEAPGGREARDYLTGRGLAPSSVRDFRLGFAPDQRGALRKALNARGVDDALLLEAGLLKQPEGGGPLRDYFFNRMIFPIPDRRGRIIAFGGRAMAAEAKPKYVNSPDSPLFHKGRVLYNMARARQAAHDGNPLIVAEGYMDVIALARAGFPGAVAPLGTAITEEQIAELWRMAPEPVLCLDGDAAGQRAAQRAIERALPALRPGCSLAFATLPAGEDPDSLIAAQGAGAMSRILAAARPLAEVLWQVRLAAGRCDTPERRAALRQDLMAAVERIQDPGVRQEYRQEMLRRFDEAFGFRRRGGAGAPGGRWQGRAGERPRGRGPGGWDAPDPRPAPPRQSPALLRRRPEQVLLALALAHPEAALDRVEELAAAPLQVPEHRRLREALLDWLAEAADLDSSALWCHLRDQGFSGLLDGLTGPQIYLHESLARPEAPPRDVRKRIGYWILRVRESGEGLRGGGARSGRTSSAADAPDRPGDQAGGEAPGDETLELERARAEESTAQQRVIEQFDISEVAE